MQIEEICGLRVVLYDFFNFPQRGQKTELGRIGESYILLAEKEGELWIQTEFATVRVLWRTRLSVIATRDKLIRFIHRSATVFSQERKVA